MASSARRKDLEAASSPASLLKLLQTGDVPHLKIVDSKSMVDPKFHRFAVYVIKVRLGHQYLKIYRRYTQFRQLAAEVGAKFGDELDLPSLPKKHIFRSSTDKEVVRARMSLLQQYLDSLMEHRAITTDLIFAAFMSPASNPKFLSLERPDCEGELFKQGHLVRNWKKRYFILKNDLLYYLRHKGDVNPISAVPMKGTHITFDPSKEFCIRLIPRGKASQPFLIAAASQHDLDRWMVALSAAAVVEKAPAIPPLSLPAVHQDVPRRRALSAMSGSGSLSPVGASPPVDIALPSSSPSKSPVSSAPTTVIESLFAQQSSNPVCIRPSSSRPVSRSSSITQVSRTHTEPSHFNKFMSDSLGHERASLPSDDGTIMMLRSRLHRTGSDVTFDLDESTALPSIQSKKQDELNEAKKLVDEALKGYLVSLNQALVRCRFGGSDKSAPTLTTSQDRKSLERKLSDRRSMKNLTAGTICSPRVNRNLTDLLETLKESVKRFSVMTLPELVQGGQCKEIMLSIQGLSSRYKEEEERAFINSLLFILSPLSRKVALTRHEQDTPNPHGSRKQILPHMELETCVNTAIMRAVAFLGSAVGISMEKSAQQSFGGSDIDSPVPSSPALTPRRILDGADRDSLSGAKAVYKKKLGNTTPRVDRTNVPTSSRPPQVKALDLTNLTSDDDEPPAARVFQGRKRSMAMFKAGVAGMQQQQRMELLSEASKDDSSDFTMVLVECGICDEPVTALTRMKHEEHCKRAYDLLEQHDDADWNEKILLLADLVHDRCEELEEQGIPSPYLLRMEKAARAAATLGATYKQREKAEKTLCDLRELVMHGKHVEECALLAYGQPLFHIIRGKYISVIPVGTLQPAADPVQARVTVDSFEKVKPISKGAFGRVDLVRMKGTEQVYARKTLRKSDMIDKNLVDQVITERNILATTENPYVVQMYYAFQNRSSLFLYMEYLPGGDCASLLENVGYFDEDMAKLYIAETVMAISYLHSKKVVHRDVKPDNLLIAQDGHIKLTDFGLSRVGFFERAPAEEDIRKGLSGHRVVGTPDYLSPEALLGTGSDKSMDWWAVGVTLFEFLTGVPPFNDETPEKIFQNILNRDIPWPEIPDEMSHEAEDLIKRLLTMDPVERLGSKGVEEIKAHEFFKDINWDTLYLEPRHTTFVPRVADKYDTGYFTPRGPPAPANQPVDHDSFAQGGDEDLDLSDAQRQELFAGFSWRYLPSNEEAVAASDRPGSSLSLNFKKEQFAADAMSRGTKPPSYDQVASSSDEDYGDYVDPESSLLI